MHISYNLNPLLHFNFWKFSIFTHIETIRQPRVHATTASTTDPVLPKPTCGLIETALKGCKPRCALVSQSNGHLTACHRDVDDFSVPCSYLSPNKREGGRPPRLCWTTCVNSCAISLRPSLAPCA